MSCFFCILCFYSQYWLLFKIRNSIPVVLSSLLSFPISDDLFFFVFVLYYIRFCFCFCICFSLTLPILYRYVCSFFICSENSFLMPTYVFHNLKHFYFFVLILLKTQEMYKFLEKHSCLINTWKAHFVLIILLTSVTRFLIRGWFLPIQQKSGVII